MKSNKLLLLGALLLATTLFACKKGGVSSSFDKSYDAWLAFKKKTNDTYVYVAVHDVKSSTYSETKITVTQGNITARDFVSYQYVFKPDSDITTKVLTDDWHESGGSLNTHGSTAANLYTLDDIYYKAQNIWLKANTNKNVVTFEAKNDGLISIAGYTPKNCPSGDCFIGINIKSITH
ncbi:hypothetical protein [Mucilaginibacter panaciglaebae]|uniref:Uncharacterized protein n=1 Tax=Mucilaginibacter panaciglaebae TaxID=502331 RepID=A0ABP7WJZ0_9SPHI